MRQLVYYVACSIDGFIADAAGDTAAFPQDPATLQALFDLYPETCPAHAREALGVSAGPRRFDTVLMGGRTALPAIEAGLGDGAYPHLRQIVATRRNLPLGPAVERWEGELSECIAAMKSGPGADIWLCGGGELAGQLVDHIDEYQLKVNPVVLGEGVPLVSGSSRPTALPRTVKLAAAESLPGDVQLLTYRRA